MARNTHELDDDVERGYYVYIHKDKTEGIPFYVGKGKGRRAFDRKGRNPVWKDKVRSLNSDYEVEIVQSNLTEEEAYDLERELIRKYGKISEGTGSLINWTDGGSLDFGENPVVEIGIRVPSELAYKWKEEYDNTTYKTLTRQQEQKLTSSIVEQMEKFADTFEKVGHINDEDDDEATDFEENLGSVIWEVLGLARKRSRRKVSYKDFCWDIEELFGDIEYELEDLDLEGESPEVVALARRIQGFLQATVALVKG